MDLVDPSSPLPPWFSNEDLAAYADLYKNSEFRTALQVPYRYILCLEAFPFKEKMEGKKGLAQDQF